MYVLSVCALKKPCLPNNVCSTGKQTSKQTVDKQVNKQFLIYQGRVVRKQINANPGLKVNRRINFSCLKLFSTAYVLCSLSLVKYKTEEGTL